MIKIICYIISASAFLSSCAKNTETNISAANTIDVSKQWKIDPNGIVLLSLGDGQWQTKMYTTQELSLFSNLDTADLNGTTTPTSVLETPPNFNSTAPNPFSSVIILPLRFGGAFSGRIVFKCVITDSTMTPYFKASSLLNVSNSTTALALNPPLPIGRFRLYFTLSSVTDPHFYKSWGNIQKTP